MGSPVVSSFLHGVSGSIIMYGQTGSGKTYTMFGPDCKASTGLGNKNVATTRGIVPRAMTSAVRFALANNAHLSLTYVEVFGDTVTDLLSKGNAIGAWSGVAARAVLDGAASVPLTSLAQAENLLVDAENSKSRAATAMNERSSRAHTLILLQLRQRTAADSELESTLCLADLGGCE